MTFTILSNVTNTLNLTDYPIVSLGGTDAGQFSIIQPSASSTAAGDSLDFTITFSPTTNGAKTASISIASDDPDDNPFSLTINGTGVTRDIIVKKETVAVSSTDTITFTTTIWMRAVLP